MATINKEKYKFPSLYGSHKVMLVVPQPVQHDIMVVCEDSDGQYITEKSRLDDGLSDPFRCATIEFRFAKLVEITVPKT